MASSNSSADERCSATKGRYGQCLRKAGHLSNHRWAIPEVPLSQDARAAAMNAAKFAFMDGWMECCRAHSIQWASGSWDVAKAEEVWRTSAARNFAVTRIDSEAL